MKLDVCWHAGTLIKLVYFSRNDNWTVDDKGLKSPKGDSPLRVSSCHPNYAILNGRIHFAKFETSKINECLEFIRSKKVISAGMYLNLQLPVTSP